MCKTYPYDTTRDHDRSSSSLVAGTPALRLAAEATMSLLTNKNPNGAPPLDAAGVVAALQTRSSELGEIPFTSIHSVRPRVDDIDKALAGQFRLGEEQFELRSPIDWSHEAYRSGDGRGFFQNSFVFADSLLQHERYAETLEELRRVFADWIVAHPLSGEPPHKYAWYDHAVAGRLVYMSFVLREMVRRDLSGAPFLERIAGIGARACELSRSMKGTTQLLTITDYSATPRSLSRGATSQLSMKPLSGDL